jgi:hypothetical protein
MARKPKPETIPASDVALDGVDLAATETDAPPPGGVVDAPTVPVVTLSNRAGRMSRLTELDEILAAAETEARNPHANADVTIARARAIVADLLAGR